jgi:hypothetical protein
MVTMIDFEPEGVDEVEDEEPESRPRPSRRHRVAVLDGPVPPLAPYSYKGVRGGMLIAGYIK